MKRLIIVYIAALLLSTIYCKPVEGKVITTFINSILNTILYVGIWYVLVKWESSRDEESWRKKLSYYFLIPLGVVTLLEILFLILDQNFGNFAIVLPAMVYAYLTINGNKYFA